MSFGSFFKKVGKKAIGINGSDEDQIKYAPTPAFNADAGSGLKEDQPPIKYDPPQGGSMSAPPSRQDARYKDPLDDNIVYAPEPQQGQQAGIAPATAGTMADQYMARATPIEDITRARRTQPAPTGPAPASVTYTTKRGQQVPTGAEGGADDLERNQAYLQALESYKPVDHNGRIKSALIGAGRAYLRGGGLVGATTGLIAGAVDPGMDERQANELAIAKTSRAVTQGQAARAAAQKIQNDQAENDFKRAEAYKAMNPTYRPNEIKTDEGWAMVDSSGKATPITYNPTTPGQAGGQAKLPPQRLGAKAPVIETVGPGGRKERWETDAQGKPTKQVAVMTPDGLWVSPNEMVNARALAGQRDFQQKEETKRDNERSQDKEQSRQDRNREIKEKIGHLTGVIDGYKQKRAQIESKITDLQGQLGHAQTPDEKTNIQNSIDGWQNELTKAQGDATSAASELQTSHGDLFKAGVGEKNWVYYERKPLSLSTWRKNYPKATKVQEDAWKQNMSDLGFEVTK